MRKGEILNDIHKAKLLAGRRQDAIKHVIASLSTNAIYIINRQPPHT